MLGAAYYPAIVGATLRQVLGDGPRGRLRTLLYHDIPSTEVERFAAQLRWLARRWRFLSPEEFERMVSGEDSIRGHNLLVTFDDGFATNAVVAREVLKPMGIRAIFFVIPRFVALTDEDDARCFIATYIQPGGNPATMPRSLYNMGWSALEKLVEEGHVIGAHTDSHACISSDLTDAQLSEEIVGSATTLERRLGCPVDHFAFTFGDVKSFSRRAMAVAAERFRFVHSGLRGDNARGVSPLALRRDSVAPGDSLRFVGALLEGAADVRYASSRAELDSWARSAVVRMCRPGSFPGDGSPAWPGTTC